jgi:Glycosyl hydrolase family 63 N-terminal domain
MIPLLIYVLYFVQFGGDHKESLYWGTYRPHVYLGIRARCLSQTAFFSSALFSLYSEFLVAGIITPANDIPYLCLVH